MSATTHLTPDAQARYLAEDGRWHFGRIVRVRRGGRTVELRIGKRIVAVHVERVREIGGRS